MVKYLGITRISEQSNVRRKCTKRLANENNNPKVKKRNGNGIR